MDTRPMSNVKKNIIEPRLQTPVPGMRVQTGTACLPDDLISEHVQRLAVTGAVGAGLWTFGFVMDMAARPFQAGPAVSVMSVAIQMLGILISAALVLYIRRGPHAPEVKADVGIAYMVLNAVAVALLNTWARPVTPQALGLISWNTIVILIGSMLLPTTPRKMLVASIAAASMDPLGIWIAHLRGIAVPSFTHTLMLFMPNYACAVVATLPAHVLQRVGRRLRQAQELGSYHLVELLGRGGMGEVWRAEHRLLARGAAIKVVRPELLGASTETEARTMLRRFEREARATAALSSPHTIRVFDFGVTADRRFYYVMELLSGRDLETLVREFGPVPADRVLFLLRQVCHSLADAHARGLVHRDVTPANIYACRMGLEYDFVKVLDFGLVKLNDAAAMQQTLMTGVHTTTGTPAFMAPEIILNEGEVDQRADVYALGCVAYFLLTGQLVFEAETPMKMFLQHLQATPVPPSQRTELPIPRDVEQLVLACLEKDPAKRPQDAQALLRMVLRCRGLEHWDHDAARGWWETNLPELTGPLGVSDAPATCAEDRQPVDSRAHWLRTTVAVPPAISR
jgi:tRNA A-37 threonylcarbamoyl transferase component Bud32